MLDKHLLDILVCPKCKGSLAYFPDEEALDCGVCKLRYRIDDDIPVMLINEAAPIPAGSSADK